MATQEISRPITPHRNPYAESSQQLEDFSREAWEELLCEVALQALEED